MADRLHRSGPSANGSNGNGSNGNGFAVPATLDPLAVLAMAASVTSRVRQGTGVLAAAWYRPELLARSLASLDVLSEGRLIVGLDLGGGAEAEEVLDCLHTRWEGSPMGVLNLAPCRRPPLLLSGARPRVANASKRRWSTSSGGTSSR